MQATLVQRHQMIPNSTRYLGKAIIRIAVMTPLDRIRKEDGLDSIQSRYCCMQPEEDAWSRLLKWQGSSVQQGCADHQFQFVKTKHYCAFDSQQLQ